MIQHLVNLLHFLCFHRKYSSWLAGILRESSVRFILHTEPSVSPPEFTIIIHTEGGPATHVLWGWSNEAVQEDSDHQMSQLIVDTSHNSVYENRLRVRGRENGTYLCYIINNVNEYFPGTISLLLEQLRVMGMYKYYTITFHKLFSLQLLENPPV